MFHPCQLTENMSLFLKPVFKYEKTMEVNRCGFHLIYSEDLHQSRPLTTQRVQMLEYAMNANAMGRDASGVLGAVT